MSLTHFCAISYRFRDIQFVNIWFPKSRSRSRITIYAMTPFDGKCQNLQMSSTHFYKCEFVPFRMLPEAKILQNSAILIETLAIEWCKYYFSSLWSWPTFSRSKFFNINVSQMVRASAKRRGRHLYIVHLPSNGVIANIALCDLDFLFERQTLKFLDKSATFPL